MVRIFLPIITLASFSLGSAYSTAQTDWSGGDGVRGPVFDWDDSFFLDTDIDCFATPGFIRLRLNSLILIDPDFPGAWDVEIADLDNDGDPDVLAASGDADDISWWENSDTAPGHFYTRVTVDDAVDWPRAVHAVDVNGDGYDDIVGAIHSQSLISWWENPRGDVETWSEHVVDPSFSHPASLDAADLDGDGDQDLLSVSLLDDIVQWWENFDGVGDTWLPHVVYTECNGGRTARFGDLDGDGDQDITAAATYDERVYWWKNLDGSGSQFDRIQVSAAYGVNDICLNDLDRDGDLDLMAACSFDQKVLWWENLYGDGTSWEEHEVASGYSASAVHPADMDNDDDVDLVVATSYDYLFLWFEDLDGLGNEWGAHIIDSDALNGNAVAAADLDGDGWLDVLGAVGGWEQLAWWNLREIPPEGELESSVLDTQDEPVWGSLSWVAQTPAGTSVAFQVRSTDDLATPWSWSDPITSPCPLAGILEDGDRFLQYRAILQTSDPSMSPILEQVNISWNGVGIQESTRPTELTELLPFQPNPVIGIPRVRFTLAEPGIVSLRVYDLSGRLVVQPLETYFATGAQEVVLEEFPPGIYVCRMDAGECTWTARFVVIE